MNRAMILAAGLGTRLRPWTLYHPKALVPVAGVPMVRRVMQRLIDEGFKKLGINVCHFADQLKEYIQSEEVSAWLSDCGASITVSDETGNLLETGGGIVKMGPQLDPDREGFLVHNADILSNAYLKGLRDFHIAAQSDATLLVSDRESSRKISFAPDCRFAEWHNIKDGNRKSLLAGGGEELAFSGIYIIGGKALEEMEKLYGGARFSVMDYFLNPERKCKVVGLKQPGLQLLDIGKPDALDRAAGFLDVIS